MQSELSASTLIDSGLRQVRVRVLDCLEGTSLHGLTDLFGSVAEGGKMLRSRLILTVGAAAGMSRSDLVRSGAAVEMLHAASLLHDDIVDGAIAAKSGWIPCNSLVIRQLQQGLPCCSSI